MVSTNANQKLHFTVKKVAHAKQKLTNYKIIN